MLREICLDGMWELAQETLGFPLDDAPRLQERSDGWIPAPVPGDIHQALVDAGTIQEPLVGMNSFDCHWTESRSWWYRKRFVVDETLLNADTVELELNGLDSNAAIFINGEPIGNHRNAFRPFVAEVKSRLVEGENTVLVRVTTGVDTVTEADMDAPDGVRAGTEAGHGRPERGDSRRALVRKPQFSFGWDWSPRVATTAIAGHVMLRAISGVCIRDVRLVPEREADGAVELRVTVLADYQHHYKTCEGTVTVALVDQDGQRFETTTRALLRSGYTHIPLSIRLPDAKLWWPNGLGEQHRYRVEAAIETQGDRTEYAPFAYGVRFVELDTDQCFALRINGCKIFCKGGNWIPTDAIYARADSERYDQLVREARDAHFTMLRVWGGGLYEPDAFYDACDRYGILVWQDFMFSCSPYPDHMEWFRREVECEADYQTRRLRRYACIGLWSGANENNWAFLDWWGEQTRGGSWCYNYALPEAVHRNCPELPYWNGSPYGGENPNSEEVGDRHHWHECMMHPEMDNRITPELYDDCNALFVSEYGYVGSCVRESVETYLNGPLDRASEAWRHHTNTFEKDTVEAGIQKHYTDTAGLSIDDYLMYSGLCQGLMYAYSLESMRYRSNCHGALFWMYNDCWGELGWTIVDYYLRRKPSYYFVRRAFAPLRLILRGDGPDHIQAVLANDTRVPFRLTLEYGYVCLDGSDSALATTEVDAAALTRTPVCRFAKGDHDPESGLWIVRAPGHPEIEPAFFRATDHRALKKVDPGLSVAVTPKDGETVTVQVSAQAYVHAVTLCLPPGCVPQDNYFDLLPGESRTIDVSTPQPLDADAVDVTCYGSKE